MKMAAVAVVGPRRPFDKLRAVPSASLGDGERSRTVSEVEPRLGLGAMHRIAPTICQAAIFKAEYHYSTFATTLSPL
jgi:hypothetical protein